MKKKRRKRIPIYGTMTILSEIFEVAHESNTLLAEVSEQIDEKISPKVWHQLTDATSFVGSDDGRYFMDLRVALADYLVGFRDRLDDIAGENWNDEDVGYSIDGYVIDDGVIGFQITPGRNKAAYIANSLDGMLAAETWFYDKWWDKPTGFRSSVSTKG